VAWQRVERLGDLDVLIAGDLRLTPEGNLVGGCRTRKQDWLLLGFEILARRSLRAAGAAEAGLLAAPMDPRRPRVRWGAEDFARKAIVTHGRHRTLDAAFVARMADARGIDMEPAGLRVFEKRRRQARRQRVGLRDDRRGVIRNEDLENPPEKLPRGFAGFD